MYKFVDTVAGRAQVSPMSLLTKFNGIVLDNELTDESGSFTTLTVSGRGLLNKRIQTLNVAYNHGAQEKSFTYDARLIRVKYKLKDSTNEGLREKFNRLSLILGQAKKRLSFTDEDAYFIATLEDSDLPEEESNDLVGTLVFVCNDPAKYKAEKKLNVTPAFSTHTLNISDKTHWISKTTFSQETKDYTLELDGVGRIVLNYTFGVGDILEIDSRTRKITLNGVTRMPLLAFASVWFQLQGTNRLKASYVTDVTYIEKLY